jgi:phosphoribosylamine--glycine ligase
MKVLIIGSGGREHAIALQVVKSKLITELFCINGNAGIAEICQTYSEISINNHDQIIEFCQNKKINFVIISPEQPLIEGLSDSLRKNNINCFGPSQVASILEGSKIFMKDLCRDYNIPTAQYQKFFNKDDALESLSNFQPPYVIKADGIAAGKGVIIAQNESDGIKAIEEMFAGKFGDAGHSIIIEEFLEGKEVSLFYLCDGNEALYFSDACDHKKIGENEKGLNTGGMGTYSPSFLVDDKLRQEIESNIIYPTLKGMRDKKMPFSGFLFAGIIITKQGAKLLEFNIRFGDPEAQVIFPRLKSDLLELMLNASKGNIFNGDSNIEFSKDSAVCVVMAAKGYPEKYKKGTKIKNLEYFSNKSDAKVFHAGTKLDDFGNIVSNGGRVLNVVAFDKDIKIAINKAYEGVSKIDWHDAYFRKDIGIKSI